MKQIRNKERENRKRAVKVFIIILLVCAAVALFVLYRHNSSKDFGAANTNPSTDTPLAQKDQGKGAIVATKGDTPVKASSLDEDIQPSTPSGVFVSNHSPNLSGSPAPSIINSTCTTTPGAFCQISFTNGSTEKQLPKQMTDSAGNTSWDWDVNNIGLTEGVWKVTATASNSELRATASDPLELRVRP